MSNHKKNHNAWFGVILRDGTVYIGNKQDIDEAAGVKYITVFVGNMEDDNKVKLSDQASEKTISLRTPTSRIPRTMEHIDSDIEFLKMLKKNKICGDNLLEKLTKSNAKESEMSKLDKASANNKGTKLKF